MSYLPNSIERCAPILGFDPYAYIMDKPSNLQINKMTSPYDVDYFAKEPHNIKEDTQKEIKTQHKENKGKNTTGGFFTALKIGAAGTSIVALAIAAKKGIGVLGKLFGKIPGNKNIKSPKTGKFATFTNTITSSIKNGWSFISNKACDFAHFVSKNFQNFVNFVKKKP